MHSGGSSDDESDSCPNCGADLATGAVFCRECGASEDSGWNDDVIDTEAGYCEDEDFDYDDFIRREFPGHASPPTNISLKRFLMITLVVLLCLSLLSFSIIGF